MFVYRNQPLKTLYLIYNTIVILTIRLPYWVAVSAISAWRPRPTWSFTRSFAVAFAQTLMRLMYEVGLPPNLAPEAAAQSADKLGFVWVDALPERFVLGEIADMAKINGVVPARISGYWHGKRAADGKYAQSAGPDENVIYHIHGGAHVMGTAAPTSYLYTAVPEGLLASFAAITKRVFALEYRLSSATPFAASNPFPAALIDILAGYRYLITDLGFRPENIIVTGDSAGGNLAAAFTRYLVQHPVFPLPRALVLLSPVLDWGGTHDDTPTCSLIRNARTDFVYVILQNGYSARALTGALPLDTPQTNAWISPASHALATTEGVFAGFPPTCIVAGGGEMALDGMRTGRDRFVRDNGAEKLLYLEYPDATHDFLTAFGHAEEQAAVVRDLREWANADFTVKKHV